jgi:prepilin peptidase CpaA
MIALGFGLMAAISDVRRLTIPNLTVLAVLGAFIPVLLLLIFWQNMPLYDGGVSHLMAGGVTFAGTFLLFYLNLLGGGDAKLLSVFALWVGMSSLLSFLFYVTLAGGLMGIATLFLQKYKPVKVAGVSGWVDAAQAGQQKVAYGPAIFFGAACSFIQKGYFAPQQLMAIAQGGAA